MHDRDVNAAINTLHAGVGTTQARATSAADPATDETVPLFTPRIQSWSEHFEWIQNGQVLRGLTPTGRATIVRLRMNQSRLVEARSIWILAGIHPPHTQ